jgi:hypothetical protein
MSAKHTSFEGGETDYQFINLAARRGPPPSRQWVLDRLIPLGAVSALYGDGGLGKSMLALNLMAEMSRDDAGSFLGLPVMKGASVGLFAEDDEDELVRRLQRISEEAGVPYDAIAEKVAIISGVGIEPTVNSSESRGHRWSALMDALIVRAQTTGARLLVLDYAAAVFSGDELDRAAVSNFMRALQSLAREHDLAVLLLGHPSIEGMRGGRGTSGSTAWRNQARSFLHLVAAGRPDDDGQTRLSLVLSKSNYAKAGMALSIAFDGTRFEVVETGLAKQRNRRVPHAQQVALAALRAVVAEQPAPDLEAPGPVRAPTDAWRSRAYKMNISPAGTMEANRKAFQTARSALQVAGLVETDGATAWLVPGVG